MNTYQKYCNLNIFHSFIFYCIYSIILITQKPQIYKIAENGISNKKSGITKKVPNPMMTLSGRLKVESTVFYIPKKWAGG